MNTKETCYPFIYQYIKDICSGQWGREGVMGEMGRQAQGEAGDTVNTKETCYPFIYQYIKDIC